VTINAVVTGIYIYPVKGCRGITLQQSVLQGTGFQFDRHWMIVMPNGRMVTQRQMPRLASLMTQILNDQLIISVDREPDQIIDLQTIPEIRVPVSVWQDSFTALDEGPQVSGWLTRVLSSKYPLRLVRMARDLIRPQSKPGLMGEHTSTLFADAAPYLLANEASLEQVNFKLMGKGLPALPMNRFRPNIVVRGYPAFLEYQKGELSDGLGRYALRSCYPCERCIVTTINQATGGMDKLLMEPLTTLLEMQTSASQKGAYFGQNVILGRGAGRVMHIGDRLDFAIE
jgi:hypothetical protein